MSQPDEILPPADSATPLPRPLPDDPHDQRGWTRARQAGFLRALSATHSIKEAARSVGMSRQSAYRLRSRLKGQAFDLAWEVAFHHSYDVLAHAALERALNGVEVPVFFQGEQVGSYRRFDERLTVALLQWSTAGNVPVLVEVILERVTNISMGGSIDAVNECEELATTREHAPTATLPIPAGLEQSAL